MKSRRKNSGCCFMSRKNKLLMDAGVYSIASILTQAVTLLAAILTRRFLGPTQMGIWSLLQVILVYSAYTGLGVSEAISREIPYYRGQGDERTAKEIKDVIFTFSLLTTFALSAAVMVYALWKADDLRPEVFFGLLFTAVLVILQKISNLNIAFLRGYKFFSLASKQMILSSIVNALLVAFLSMRNKIYGFLWAMCLSFIFNIVYISAHHRFGFRWNMNWKRTWALIEYGFPLMVVGLMGTVFLTIDKLMIAKFLGFKELGIYSVAILTYTYLVTVPNAIGIVLIPNLHEKFGESKEVGDLKEYLEKSCGVFGEIMPLLIAGGWFFIPYFARWVLPDYLESIEPMRTLILSSYFLALTQPHSYFIAVIRKQILLLPVISIACFLAFTANLWTIKHGYGILGVSAATTLVVFIRYAATYFLASKYLCTVREAWQGFFVKIARFILMLAMLLVLKSLFPGAERSFVKSVAQWGMFAVASLPFLLRLNKEVGFLSVVRAHWASGVFVKKGEDGV